jgi:hypothetical protein
MFIVKHEPPERFAQQESPKYDRRAKLSVHVIFPLLSHTHTFHNPLMQNCPEISLFTLSSGGSVTAHLAGWKGIYCVNKLALGTGFYQYNLLLLCCSL